MFNFLTTLDRKEMKINGGGEGLKPRSRDLWLLKFSLLGGGGEEGFGSGNKYTTNFIKG